MNSRGTSFYDKQAAPVTNTSMVQTINSGTRCVSGMQPSQCSNARPGAGSDSKSTKDSPPKKASHQKKKLESGTDVSTNSSSSPKHHPNLGAGPRLPMISANTSTSSSRSTSIGSSTTTVATKSSDAKISDSHSTASIGRNSSNRCDSVESTASAPIKRHTGSDCRWDAIQLAISREPSIGIGHFRLLKRLGYGDIGSVYLVELRGIGTYFAMKVMDKASIVSRNKLLRAQTEREILGMLNHPFLPSLYAHFETEKFYCLVMEYCSGGNLHSLRQKQPKKYFSEQAARFYASEVLLAIEYLHMLGIIYRDLKPENVLVREEGHIMLSDFDLSLRCSVDPTLVKSTSARSSSSNAAVVSTVIDGNQAVQGCIQPSSFFPRILPKKNRKSKSDFGVSNGNDLEFMAEPTNARSMSFVGTHEYLAPEIIRGEGHGSAVDWWTFGIFLYELLHGTTPFKGSGNRATLHNVVGQPLTFPDTPIASLVARDLIHGLLVKDPQRRIAYHRGATEIKQHPFFDGINWALVRSTSPPHIPEPVNYSQFASKEKKTTESGLPATGNSACKGKSDDSSHLDFDYF